ncbi:MAG: hypothetical protein ACP6IP_00860 [Candidatus Njordarchaeia archaeon]
MKIKTAMDIIYDYLTENDDTFLTKSINVLHFIIESYRSIILFKMEGEYGDVLIKLQQAIERSQKKLLKLSKHYAKMGFLDLADALEILYKSDLTELVENSKEILIRFDTLNERRKGKMTYGKL